MCFKVLIYRFSAQLPNQKHVVEDGEALIRCDNW